MNPRFLLFRLRHAQGTDFYPVLDEVLSHADALDEDSVSELTALVEQKISAGWRTPGTPLAKLARFTKASCCLPNAAADSSRMSWGPAI